MPMTQDYVYSIAQTYSSSPMVQIKSSNPLAGYYALCVSVNHDIFLSVN